MLILVLGAPPAGAQIPGTLELISSEGVSRMLSPEDLATLPAIEVTITNEAPPTTYAGPTIRDLLTLAGAPSGRSLRGPAMSMVLLAEAADGYTVAFTISEMDPQFGNRRAIVATNVGGHPLSERDGPLQLVLPEDEFHARWVRQLVRIRVIQLAGGSDVPTHR
jgi:hypothetical protein